jgi:ketosteroid isomerase-like protein
MRTVIRLFFVPLVIVLQACMTANRAAAPPPVPPMPPAVPTGGTVPTPRLLREAHPAYNAAWNGTDAAAVAAFFTEDARVVVGDSTYHGRARIVEGWIRPNLPASTEAIPDAFTTGESQITESGQFGYRTSSPAAPRSGAASYVNVWARQPDGSWRISAITVTPAPRGP